MRLMDKKEEREKVKRMREMNGRGRKT